MRMEDGDDDDLHEACGGTLCFTQPHPHYVPPPFHPRFPRREYRWKIGAKAAPGFQCKISHAVTLPNILGVGPEAHWRWPWIPVSLATSVIMRIRQQYRGTSERGGVPRSFGVAVSPRVRLKVLTPVLGKLAVRPVVELFPAPRISLSRPFQLGNMKLSAQANLEMSRSGAGSVKWPEWSLQVNWHLTDAVRVILEPVKDNFLIKGSRSFGLLTDRKVVAGGLAEVPVKAILNGASGFLRSLPLLVGLDSLKVSQVITDKAAKSSPLSSAQYLSASRSIGMSDMISVIPGHWIDPGPETGSPGEREFNMDVANMTEKQLTGNGWKVLRPDRDSPNLTWEEYLNWVSKQTAKGVPVLEIHGQGSAADHRGLVLGVIGDANAPLNKELAKDFGHYKMDWMGLGVPKRGGSVLESFNSDEVLRMAPWDRKWSVRWLATRIVKAVERAGRANRSSRGVVVDYSTDEDARDLEELPSAVSVTQR